MAANDIRNVVGKLLLSPTVGDCHQLGNLDCLLIVSQYVFYYLTYHFDCHEDVPERDPAGSLIIREQSPLL